MLDDREAADEYAAAFDRECSQELGLGTAVIAAVTFCAGVLTGVFLMSR